MSHHYTPIFDEKNIGASFFNVMKQKKERGKCSLKKTIKMGLISGRFLEKYFFPHRQKIFSLENISYSQLRAQNRVRLPL